MTDQQRMPRDSPHRLTRLKMKNNFTPLSWLEVLHGR